MRLQIGCGKNKLDGYITVDNDSSVQPDIITDAHNLHMIENESIDILYASHILEYYDWNDVHNNVLKEWKRVLKYNGILRIAVPDFEQISILYNAGFDLSFFIGPMYGKWKSNNDTIYHKSIYDYNILSKILRENGFHTITRWNWKEIHPKEFDDYSKSYIPHMEFERGVLISLNIECKKYGVQE